MTAPADTELPSGLLAEREERSLLRAAGTDRVLSTGQTTEVSVNPLVEQVFLAAVERDALVHVHMTDVPRTSIDLGDVGRFGRVEISWSESSGHAAVLTLEEECVALLAGGRSWCDIVVAGREPAAVGRASERLAEALRAGPLPDDRAPMRFWSRRGNGGHDIRRAIEVPDWDDIARNYPRAVRSALQDLLAAREPGGGSLILWHGAPGTGKTHGVQTLAKAWRDWCSVHCITDPEALLQSTPYLMDVVNDRIGDDERAYRLIVLEDAGELMAVSARAEVGQGLSRLLNLTDGLLGQGVRTILLVTTNEPIGRLHPAVRRPGRCWASIDFGPFDAAEATAWLALQGVDRAVTRPVTLAELYAIAEDREVEEIAGEGFGFARALTR
jgi:ATPase family associated with various cellular activities (AAA)